MEEKNNLFTIIMPTFNDSSTILETLNSIKNQSYKNWQLIIVNDGGNDDSEKIITEFINHNKLSEKIKYIYQKNMGQLRAVANAIPYIKGNIIYILHSDDVFYDEFVLYKANDYFNKSNCDGLISKLIPTFNKNYKELTGIINVDKFQNKNNSLAKLLLNNGSNLYMDMAFIRKEIFTDKYLNNYLKWNRPFWANVEDYSVLNIHSADFPFFRYRVFEGNYIQSDIGKIVEINGELRTMTDLLSKFNVPFFKIQRFVYKVMKKLKMGKLYLPLFFKNPTKKQKAYKIINSHICKKLRNTNCINDEFLVALRKFYSSNEEKTINLCSFDLSKCEILGCDIRYYYLNKGNEVVNYLIKCMKEGFSKIVVKQQDEKILRDILHFLCLRVDIDVEIQYE